MGNYSKTTVSKCDRSDNLLSTYNDLVTHREPLSSKAITSTAMQSAMPIEVPFESRGADALPGSQFSTPGLCKRRPTRCARGIKFLGFWYRHVPGSPGCPWCQWRMPENALMTMTATLILPEVLASPATIPSFRKSAVSSSRSQRLPRSPRGVHPKPRCFLN